MKQNTDAPVITQHITGIPGIDEQHNELAAQLAALLNHLGKGKPSSDFICDSFKKIMESLQLHFSTEENLLGMIGFPKKVEHISLHEKLYNQFSELAGAFEKTGDVNISDAVSALRDAGMEHIAVCDAEYAAHIEKLMALKQKYNITAVRAQILTK